MKNPCHPIFLLLVLAAAASLSAANKFSVVVTNDLDIARPAEVVTVPWQEIADRLPPHTLPSHLLVKDAGGRSLPFQLINFRPEERRDYYQSIIFQHNFAAGESKATFTIEATDTPVPPFPDQTFARYVPERFDDFAWENDRIAHRIYGPTLETPAGGKDQMVSSGIDVWCKRVRYPIVNRWYLMGHYHEDSGEGKDMYQTGQSRGCGGTGIWDGKALHVSHNWKTWKVLANGPIRTVFELGYAPWDAGNGVMVSETKRFTVDAGHNLDEVESTFAVEGEPKDLVVAIGVNKNSADKGQLIKAEQTKNQKDGWFTQWETEKTNGAIGEAVIVEPSALSGFGEDAANQLVLVKVTTGVPVKYYVGAGWTKSGDFSSEQDWNNYVAACAAQARSPLKVSFEAAP